MSMSQSQLDDGDENNDDNEVDEILEAMDEDQRNRYHHFVTDQCTFPAKLIKDKMRAALEGSSIQIAANSESCVGYAAKLFAAKLIDNARALMGNDEPIPPDMILLAYHELETRGEIPGKGVGVKISDYKN